MSSLSELAARSLVDPVTETRSFPARPGICDPLASGTGQRIRALSMDAVQRRNPATPAPRWAWLILARCCGMTFCATTRPIQNG